MRFSQAIRLKTRYRKGKYRYEIFRCRKNYSIYEKIPFNYNNYDIVWPGRKSYRYSSSDLPKVCLNHFVGMSILVQLPQFIIIYLVTIIFAGITNYISASRATQIEVSINRDLRNAAFKHLQTLSFSYYNQNSVGYIHARVMSDTARIGTLVSWRLYGRWYGIFPILQVLLL